MHGVHGQVVQIGICKNFKGYRTLRIIYGTKKYDHVTSVLTELLRCIPVKLQLYYGEAIIAFKCHGEKFWTRTRSKYTDLGEFETIWLYKTIDFNWDKSAIRLYL